jgi:cytochrome c biogenesis protein CcdA
MPYRLQNQFADVPDDLLHKPWLNSKSSRTRQTMDAIPFTLSLSLFDSLSTTQQIIIFILLLTTARPLRNSIAYLAGLCGAYFACGVGGYLAIDKLLTFIGRYIPSTGNIPDSTYYKSELISGIIMMLIGLWYYQRNRHAPLSRSQNILVARFKSMNGIFALGMGAFISVSSFPVSIPYIIALGKYASLHLDITSAVAYIMLYNIGYALPMIAILIVYLYARKKTDDLTGALQEKTRILNVHLTTWAWAGVGIFSMIDALFYFFLGHALIRNRLL